MTSRSPCQLKSLHDSCMASGSPKTFDIDGRPQFSFKYIGLIFVVLVCWCGMKMALPVPNDYLLEVLCQHRIFCMGRTDSFSHEVASLGDIIQCSWNILAFYLCSLKEVTPQPGCDMYGCVGLWPFFHSGLFSFGALDASESWEPGLQFSVSAPYLNKRTTAKCFTNVNQLNFKLF